MAIASKLRALLRDTALVGLGILSLGLVTLSGAQASTARVHLDVGGLRRSATVVEYARLKRTPRTTIIVLHGNNRPNVRGNPADGRGAQRSIGLDEQVRSASILLVYPDGYEGHWNFQPGEGKADDVIFLRTLANKLISDGLADRNRIFVTGVGTGGLMALRVACEGADFIAGVAPLISALTLKQAAICKPSRPISMMLLKGTADPIVPYGGGTTKLTGVTDDVVSAEATMAPFVQVSACAAQPRAVQPLPDRDPNDGSRIEIERFPGCRTLIELVRVEGGGHTLPGRPSRTDRGVPVGAQNNDADVARLVADFVRRAVR